MESDISKLVYICPMHPEITSGEAGKCPKCHMPLEQIKPKTNRSKQAPAWMFWRKNNK